MAIKKTLGGDRIGSESKMEIQLHDYERSTHDISRVWASSIAPGVIYPCMCQLVEDGDICEIDLNALLRTIPTNGPLFSRAKLQVEVYHASNRLYVGALHNNAVKIGLNMSKIKFPKINIATPTTAGVINNINTSSLAHYLGIGDVPQTSSGVVQLNAIKFLMYYDIVKNYHTNKQEPNAYVIGGTQDMASGGGTTIGTPPNQIIWQITPGDTAPTDPSSILANGVNTTMSFSLLTGSIQDQIAIQNGQTIKNSGQGMLGSPNTGGTGWMTFVLENVKADNTPELYRSILLKCIVEINDFSPIPRLRHENLSKFFQITNPSVVTKGTKTYVTFKMETYSNFNSLLNGDYTSVCGTPLPTIPFNSITLPENYNELFSNENPPINTGIASFPLENLDKARWTILQNANFGDQVLITGINTETPEGAVINWLPYSANASNTTPTTQDIQRNKIPMNGLMLKCYLSDIFNNWLNTDWIDGDNGINALTSVAVTNGEFTIDALNLANKVYNVLNRIAISGGTYEDWREAVYGRKVTKLPETPMYLGGASAEIAFEEVVASSSGIDGAGNSQPLGSLGGRGTILNRKGGYIRYHVDETGYIMALVSITPRLMYSQGMAWDMMIDNADQIHKPGLDGIGFQNLMANWMHGAIDPNIAIGKQPAWVQYTTAVDEAHGDFADENKAMYMIFNRRYEVEKNIQTGRNQITDATTYIDPSKYNYAFADTSLESQNYWLQIGIDFKIRKLMSARQIPNL